MRCLISRFSIDPRGAIAVEYALAAGLVGLAAVLALAALGDALNDSYEPVTAVTSQGTTSRASATSERPDRAPGVRSSVGQFETPSPAPPSVPQLTTSPAFRASGTSTLWSWEDAGVGATPADCSRQLFRRRYSVGALGN